MCVLNRQIALWNQPFDRKRINTIRIGFNRNIARSNSDRIWEDMQHRPGLRNEYLSRFKLCHVSLIFTVNERNISRKLRRILVRFWNFSIRRIVVWYTMFTGYGSDVFVCDRGYCQLIVTFRILYIPPSHIFLLDYISRQNEGLSRNSPWNKG